MSDVVDHGHDIGTDVCAAARPIHQYVTIPATGDVTLLELMKR